MLSLGPLAFAAPWLLTGLLALPIIWWLLRITPPRPQDVRFPPLRLLFDLRREEETPDKSPIWLLLLRLLAAALVILALADPRWQPREQLAGEGPLILLVDNGWASADQWSIRQRELASLTSDAARDDRPVAIIPTAGAIAEAGRSFRSADEAGAFAASLEPQPFAPDRAAAAEAVQALSGGTVRPSLVWLADGIAAEGDEALTVAIAGFVASATVVLPPGPLLPLALTPPRLDKSGMTTTVRRADPGALVGGSVRAIGEKGRHLGETAFQLSPGEVAAEVSLDLPREVRNRIRELRIAGVDSAGAVALADASTRQLSVGLVSASYDEATQPLLSDLYYVRRALGPYVEILATPDADTDSEVEALLEQKPAALILADIGQVAPDTARRLQDWIGEGGVLIRFAGPHLTATNDPLLPVPLRAGDREIGGVLSWSTPQALAPFPRSGPFAGLQVPEDVTVNTQILADPSELREEQSWARLKDGTPLVTARRDGLGWLVLFHVTAGPEWSNLPLSGNFVDMLRRAIDLSAIRSGPQAGSNADAGTASPETALLPIELLDGFGRLAPPGAGILPLTAEELATGTPGPRHPPGFYGKADAAEAFNLIREDTRLEPLGPLDSSGVAVRSYATAAERMLGPWLALAAILLLAIDSVIALALAGRLPRLRPRASSAAALMLAALLIGTAGGPFHPAQAQPAEAGTDDSFALKATEATHLAFVRTGDRTLDQVSEQGLGSLSDTLRYRTAFEPGPPIGVDIETDELSFFPILYWPMTPAQPALTPAARAKVSRYMKNGGIILFDTRDQGRLLSTQTGEGTQVLRRILDDLDVPELEPVPENHVLTRSFYLLSGFPGRYDGGDLWVQAGGQGERSHDGVSPVIIGSNDFAGAWARDANGQPIYPAVPGGEFQRELAARFGVNLVMYALTGNYKADQVHIPALLERLGQ